MQMGSTMLNASEAYSMQPKPDPTSNTPLGLARNSAPILVSPTLELSSGSYVTSKGPSPLASSWEARMKGLTLLDGQTRIGLRTLTAGAP